MKTLRILIFFTISILLLSFSFKKNSKKTYSSEAQIGRLLFFDTRLSVNGTKSCASCHLPELAFTDGFKTPLGAMGDAVKRNTPTLVNLADNETYNWAAESIVSLEQQSNIPLFGIHPIEMGNDSNNIHFLEFVYIDKNYATLLKSCKIEKIDWNIVKHLIATYVRTFKFQNAKYDLVVKGKAKFTNDELAGKKLFFSDKLNCRKCHSGNDFDEPEFTRMNKYQNIGLYNIGKDSLYANDDNGLFNESNDKDDIGKFKIPSLRNIMLTAPYFHDGSAANINDVIDSYSKGGRDIKDGPFKGDGRLHPSKNQFIEGFKITQKEHHQLISFLKTLTDTSYLKNPFYNNPFVSK
ncbi:MAG: cytochrome c peroxidase [Chitinophagaceae bacterium]